MMVPYDEGVIVVIKVSDLEGEGARNWDLLVETKSFNSNGSVYHSEEQIFTFIVE